MKFYYANRFDNYPTNIPEYLKDVWLKYFPNSKEDSSVDFEDFVECSIQLYEADKQNIDIEVYIPSLKINQTDLVLFIGNGLRSNILERNVRNLRGSKIQKQASFYASFETFQKKCDRDFILCGYNTLENNLLSVIDSLKNMYQRGIRQFLVKSVAEKQILISFDLKNGLSDDYFVNDNLMTIFGEDIAWDMVHKEGSKNTLMLQEFIPMKNEYRFVVLNNQIQCGSGVVWNFTPLNNNGNQFDNRVSNNENITKLDNQYMDDMIEFATNCTLHDFKTIPFGSYILDVAYNEKTNNFCIIELNPIHNFGLYAMNTEILIQSYINYYKYFEKVRC